MTLSLAAALLSAVFVYLFPAEKAWGADLPGSIEAELARSKMISDFRTKPQGLELLPSYPGSQDFAERHRALKAHVVQEALFLLPPDSLRIDGTLVYRTLMEAPTLTGLTYTRKGRKPYLLFESVRFVEPPEPGRERCIVEVKDTDFGTIRFDAQAFAFPGRLELRMVNLDSMRYLLFPAIPPKQALVDIVYFADQDRSLVYTAWSVRSYLFIPAAVDVETPLYRRTVALKEWFIDLLSRMGR